MKKNNLLIAIKAAIEAGTDILKIYYHPSSDFGVERKADNSPLTIADKKAHETIVSFLETTPIPILSEEGKAIQYNERKGWKTLWIVDPLDGTKEFIKKNGEFTVNIAMVSDGVPEIGVIYLPVKRILYFAEQSIGAFRLENIEKLDESESLEELMERSEQLPVAKREEGEFTVVASRSHLTCETAEYIEDMKLKYPSVKLISSGSSIKICLVAEGSADVYPRFAPTMEWDTAAGHAIAKAAGMEIYQAGKNVPLLYNKEDLLNPWFMVEKQRKEN